MKIFNIVLIFFIFSMGICFSQNELPIENIIRILNNSEGRGTFQSCIVSDKGEVFFAYKGLENVKNIYDSKSLLLAKIGINGRIEYERKIIEVGYDFGTIFVKSYNKNNYVLILGAKHHAKKAIIGIYDIINDEINVITLNDISLFNFSGCFDNEGDLHISNTGGQHHIKLDRNSKYSEVSIDKKIPTEMYLYSRNKMDIEEKYNPTDIYKSIFWKDKLITVYYVGTYRKENNSKQSYIINHYNKIAIQVLNTNDYTLEEFKIYDIEKVASEKIEGIKYPGIKIYQPDTEKMPVIFMGGTSSGKDFLYKVKLDDNAVPVRPDSVKTVAPVLTKSFPKNSIWDFAVEYELFEQRSTGMAKKLHFIGLDMQNNEKTEYYYFAADYYYK